MLSVDRQQLILKELALHGTLNTEEFAARIAASGMTVRRDLAALSAQGLLERVHGGAVLPTGDWNADSPLPASRRTGPRFKATIGMIVPSASYYFPGIIRGAEAAAQQAGVRLVLGVSNYSPAEEQRQLQRLYDHGVNGILITPSEPSLKGTKTAELLAEATAPVIVVERSIDNALEYGRLESVRSDHVHGAEIAVNHLLGLGHQNIALCLRENSPTAAQLIDGFGLAMHRAGQLHDSSMVRTMSRAENDPQAHRQVVDSILDWCALSSVTAAIVHTDEDALQFASACQERGLRIPEDFAIIAYDDEVAALGSVSLTAVAPPKFDVGHQAMTMCLRRVGRQNSSPMALQRITLSPTLVIRDSA